MHRARNVDQCLAAGDAGNVIHQRARQHVTGGWAEMTVQPRPRKGLKAHAPEPPAGGRIAADVLLPYTPWSRGDPLGVRHVVHRNSTRHIVGQISRARRASVHGSPPGLLSALLDASATLISELPAANFEIRALLSVGPRCARLCAQTRSPSESRTTGPRECGTMQADYIIIGAGSVGR